VEEREFTFIYLGELASDAKINFDKDEISEVKWVKIAKLSEFGRENNLTPAATMVLRELKILF
jgi:isopentenyldiphosphate isomerase